MTKKEKQSVSVKLEREDWKVVTNALYMYALLAHEFKAEKERGHIVWINNHIGMRLQEEIPLEERLKETKPIPITEDDLPF